jgi:hypothetical protein
MLVRSPVRCIVAMKTAVPIRILNPAWVAAGALVFQAFKLFVVLHSFDPTGVDGEGIAHVVADSCVLFKVCSCEGARLITVPYGPLLVSGAYPTQ